MAATDSRVRLVLITGDFEPFLVRADDRTAAAEYGRQRFNGSRKWTIKPYFAHASDRYYVTYQYGDSASSADADWYSLHDSFGEVTECIRGFLQLGYAWSMPDGLDAVGATHRWRFGNNQHGYGFHEYRCIAAPARAVGDFTKLARAD